MRISDWSSDVCSSDLAGHDAETIAAAMSQGTGVPGRLEQVPVDRDITVIVDYAHKPDAVEAALQTLRPLTDGRLIAVLGARSEARRVGKGCVSTCRYRCSRAD